MSTTGYSGTPLLKKPGIQNGMKLLLINQPDNYYSLLDANISDQLCRQNEVPDLIAIGFVHLFVKNFKRPDNYRV
ncbi:MAG: hypothetical protein SGI96_16295 [Bacteroidota bacterium]|nr:hypothetical protein [Bacteroidota bacterium]